MTKSIFLLLALSFACSVSGVLAIFRALVQGEHPGAYIVVMTDGALIVVFVCQVLLRFPSPELLTIYRRSLTATPLGAFTLVAVFSVGIGLGRLEVDNLAFDVCFMMWVSLLAGSLCAAFVAFRNRHRMRQNSQKE